MLKRTSSPTYQYGLKTATGAVRELNEDSCLAEPEKGLWLVADGMGGHRTGDVASQIVRDTVADRIHQGSGLREAIKSAHEEVLKVAETREGSVGMGSTVVAALVDGVDYQVAWVGDSRAYLYDGNLARISRDHSHVQDLLRAGAITPDEAVGHPGRHLLTRCLGVNAESTFEVGIASGRFVRGQEVLLCSDGLTDELSDSEIAEVLGSRATAQERVERLVNAAIQHGGRDNVTVVLFSAPADASAAVGWGKKLGILALGAGVAAGALGVAFLLLHGKM
ncbi:MAG: protein phosphatase 2C domain-containing protein [Arenicellales bacterium]